MAHQKYVPDEWALSIEIECNLISINQIQFILTNELSVFLFGEPDNSTEIECNLICPLTLSHMHLDKYTHQ